MKHLQENYTKFTNEEIKLYMDKTDREDYEEEIFMDIQLTHYPLRDFKNIYSEMSNVIKDYGNLNHRNKKKSEEGLLKHALHLIRLLIMGTEVLSFKKVNTYRENDRQLLLDIRNGKYSYDEIFSLVDKYEKEFEYARNNTELPNLPNYKKVEELMMSIYKKRYGYGK